jgi:hypothetical protein
MTSPQRDGQQNQSAVDAEPTVDADVMEKVLQETLSAADIDQPLDTAEFEVFQGVARRYAGQPLSLDPIVTELVQSILLYHFGEQMRQTRDWEKMPRAIAETLWDSPHSHDRMQRLWERMAESKP